MAVPSTQIADDISDLITTTPNTGASPQITDDISDLMRGVINLNTLNTVRPTDPNYRGPIGAVGSTVANIRQATTGNTTAREAIDRYWQTASQNLNAPIIKSGMQNFRTSAAIRASDNPREQQIFFQRAYPNGRMEYLPGTDHLVYRENADNEEEPWKTVQRFDAASEPGLMLPFMSSIVGGVGKYGPVIAGETAMLAMTRGTNFIRRAAMSALGAGTGEGARQSAQTVFGVQGDTFSGAVGIAGKEALIGGIGFAISEPIVRIFNSARGAGGFKRLKSADDAMEAIESLNAQIRTMNASRPADQQLSIIPRLTPGQALGSPLFRIIEAQSAALAGPLREHRIQQASALSNFIRSDIDYAAIARAPDAVAEALQVAEDTLLSSITNPRVYGRDAGQSLAIMEQTYRKDSQATVRTAYQEANAFEAPVFDLAPAIDVLRTIDAGLPRPARALPPQPVPEDPINRYLGITEPPQPLPPRAQPDIDLRPPEPEISQVLKELEGLDPAGVDLEALLAIREKLYDLKTPKPGETAVRIHAQAGQAYDAITNVIKNPTNSSEDFVLSWQRANGLAEQRFRTLDRALITNIVRSEQGFTTTTLSQLANTLIKPNQSENIEFLKELGLNGEVAIKYLQNTFETRILDNVLNPTEAASIITRMDKPTLDALMPTARQEQLKSLLKNVEELQRSEVRASLDAEVVAQPLLRRLVSMPNGRDYEYLNKLIDDSGGLDSDLGRAIRHGLKNNIIEKVLEAGGDRSVKNEALNQELNRLGSGETNLIRFLTPEDRKMLRQFTIISDFFKVTRGTTDFGTSLRAADIGADLYRFGEPDKIKGAIMEIVKAYGVSRFMLSDFGRGMLMGRSGVKYSELDPIRLATMVTGSIAADVRNTED
jgi:hypothetical protein